MQSCMKTSHFVRLIFFSPPSAEVSPEAAQQRQALQMLQLLPCLFRLCLAADPPVCTRHQKCQGLLLQHVWQGVHLSELQVTLFKSECTAAVMSETHCLSRSFQETYLMKHMSKHTMVEHVMSHHSPQHRTESPSIPIRISLI